jgi:membrane carboxypeptidase/penicillin-binding protein
MQEALRGKPLHNWPLPDDVEISKVNPNTGEVLKSGSTDGVTEYFLKGRLPGQGAISGVISDPANDSQKSDHIF